MATTHTPLTRARQARERFQARRGDVRMRREAVVGQGLQIRKHPTTDSAAGEKPDLLAQGLRIARTWRDDDSGPASLRRRLGDGEGRRGPVELSPFDDRGGRATGRVGSSRGIVRSKTKKRNPPRTSRGGVQGSKTWILRDLVRREALRGRCRWPWRRLGPVQRRPGRQKALRQAVRRRSRRRYG